MSFTRGSTEFRRYLVCGGENLAEDDTTRNIAKVERRQHQFHEVAAILIVAYVHEWPVCLTLDQQCRSQEADSPHKEEVVSS